MEGVSLETSPAETLRVFAESGQVGNSRMATPYCVYFSFLIDLSGWYIETVPILTLWGTFIIFIFLSPYLLIANGG